MITVRIVGDNDSNIGAFFIEDGDGEGYELGQYRVSPALNDRTKTHLAVRILKQWLEDQDENFSQDNNS